MVEFEKHIVAVVSTTHLSKQDRDTLAYLSEKGRQCPMRPAEMIVDDHPYGYRVYMSPDDFLIHDFGMWQKLNMTENFILLLYDAWKQGCRWVAFDCDGDIVGRYETHEW